MLGARASQFASRASQTLRALGSQAAGSSQAPLGRLHANETALFICDIQERFRPLIAGMPGVIDTARRLVSGAAALDIPVIVTEQYPKALLGTVEELKEVLPESAFVQDKTDFTMFVPPVRERLQQLTAVKKVLLAGIETHVCVFQTALDLIEAGYERDGVLQRIAQMGGLLVSSEMALFQMCGGAKHPAFKAISALAKEKRPDFLPLTSSL